MANIERDSLLTELGRWLLPKNVHDKSETLLVFDNNLLSVNYPLPIWWTDEYSEQFNDVPIDKIWDYVTSLKFGDKEKLTFEQIHNIQTAVFQRFRKDIPRQEIIDKLKV